MNALPQESLNAFQCLMREWAALAPFNFIHAMCLPGPADPQRWENAAVVILRQLELSPPAVVVEQPTADLETHLRAELHRPFASIHAPIRFFIINGDADQYWFGVVLDHWLADDFSCRHLLQIMYSLCCRSDDRGSSATSLERTSSTLLPRNDVWLEWWNFLRQSMILRRAARTPIRDPLDFSVETFRRAFGPGALEANRKLAKSLDVTLHDLFLAATAQAFAAERKWDSDPRRDAVAIGSAMDARRFADATGRDGFGLFLGQYIVVERRPDEVSLRELSTRIAAQTRRMKTSPGNELFAPTLSVWRLSRSSRAKATLFSRGAPMVAGLSNVNLTGSWIEEMPISDYRRIGPTGPVVPMVLMITTFRGRIFMDVTFRTAAFTPIAAKQLITDIIGRLSFH